MLAHAMQCAGTALSALLNARQLQTLRERYVMAIRCYLANGVRIFRAQCASGP